MTEPSTTTVEPTPCFEPIPYLSVLARSPEGNLGNWNVKIHQPPGSAAIFEEIVNQVKCLQSPEIGIPYPTEAEPYKNSADLIAEIRKSISEQTHLPTTESGLLAYWSLSTWFKECLPVAPLLVLTGSPYRADIILRSLKPMCCGPLLLPDISPTIFKAIDWFRTTTTLLIANPDISKKMITLLGCSTRPGYVDISIDRGQRDYYGPKAIYIGKDVSALSMSEYCLIVNVDIPIGTKRSSVLPLAKSTITSFQNRLVNYRRMNLANVKSSDFDAASLHGDIRDIANALGACIVGAPELQANLIELLSPQAEQQLADRAQSREAAIVEACLSFCHSDKPEVFVREIADKANQIRKEQGETLQLSPETTGHLMKRVGLSTRRLGKAGNGLRMEVATKSAIHRTAVNFLGVGFANEVENMHCTYCTETKKVMQEV